MGLIKKIRNEYWKPSYLYAVYKSLKYRPTRDYSQWGEDKLIQHFLLMPELNKKSGFFIDVGCNHPFSGNNFTSLYKKGWRGINIDMMPLNIRLFNQFRPKDQNILTGVSNQTGEAEAYIFSSSFALNSLDKEFADKWSKILNQEYSIKPVPIQTLDQIIEDNAKGRQIDIINIDVEGFEVNVLKGFAISKHSPTLVLCEIHAHDLEELLKQEAYQYFKENGYRLVSRCGGTCFFVKDDFDCGF